MKFKAKKKKTKSTRKRAADDDDVLFTVPTDNAMEVDLEPVVYTKKKKIIDDTFVDDDDLQADQQCTEPIAA